MPIRLCAFWLDASPQEQGVLAQLGYQANEVILHTDTRLLPRQRRAWASWNYRLPASDEHAESQRASVTYKYEYSARL